MKRINYLLAGVVVLLLMATGVQAGHRAESFTLSPMIGGWLFDSDLELGNSMAFGGAAGYNFTERLGLEGAFLYSDLSTEGGRRDFLGRSLETDLSFYRLDGLYHFMPEKRLVPYVAAGLGGVIINPRGLEREHEASLNFGAGLKYFVTDDIALRADIREVLTFPETSLLYTFGLSFYFGGRDKAVQSPPKKAVVEKSDDEVLEEQAEQAEARSQVEEVEETPPVTPVEDDKYKDDDGDGVLNYLDACPGTPRGAMVDSRGCWVIENLRFDTNKDDIKPEFFAILNAVVKVLKMNPDLRVEIQGYTDNRGPDAFNRHLSQKRARAVRVYLAGQGVDDARMTSKGYGPDNPAATNQTPEGRAQNRRVEIKPLP